MCLIYLLLTCLKFLTKLYITTCIKNVRLGIDSHFHMNIYNFLNRILICCLKLFGSVQDVFLTAAGYKCCIICCMPACMHSHCTCLMIFSSLLFCFIPWPVYFTVWLAEHVGYSPITVRIDSGTEWAVDPMADGHSAEIYVYFLTFTSSHLSFL